MTDAVNRTVLSRVWEVVRDDADETSGGGRAFNPRYSTPIGGIHKSVVTHPYLHKHPSSFERSRAVDTVWGANDTRRTTRRYRISTTKRERLEPTAPESDRRSAQAAHIIHRRQRPPIATASTPRCGGRTARPQKAARRRWTRDGLTARLVPGAFVASLRGLSPVGLYVRDKMLVGRAAV